MKAKKELGQNFLKDNGVVIKLVEALEIKGNDCILEIGPGMGVITIKVISQLPESAQLHAVEFDERFISTLKSNTNGLDNVKIIHDNILDFLPRQAKALKINKIIGAIPYNITSPIVHKIIYLEELPDKVVLLIQKEVAQKIHNLKPKASYLSTFINTFYETELLDIVKAEAFDPAPKVDSQIIVLNKKSQAHISHDEKHRYEGFLHRAFSNPRKMLNKVFSEDELNLFDIEPTKRPQEVAVEKWVESFTRLNGQ